MLIPCILFGVLVTCVVYKILSEKSTRGVENENYFHLLVENTWHSRTPAMKTIIQEINELEQR